MEKEKIFVEKKEKLTPKQSLDGAINSMAELYEWREMANTEDKISGIIEDLDNARSLQLDPEEKSDLASTYNRFIEKEDFRKAASVLESVTYLLNDGLDSFTVEETERMNKLRHKGRLSLEESRELNRLELKSEKMKDWIEAMSFGWISKKGKYEEFDPYLELKKIRHGTPEERKKRLAEYKEQLARQKEGIADLQVELEKKIRDNPDIPTVDFIDLIHQKASELKLSARQIGIFLKTFCKYREKHRAVDLYRKQYKDDKKFYEACFSHSPKGNIEIIKGPMTLYFRCHNLKDYAWIYKEEFRPDEKLDKYDIGRARMTGGTSILTAAVPELKGTILAENARGRPFGEWSKGAIKHEEQHAIQSLFKEERFRGNYRSLFAVEDFSKEESQKALEDYLRHNKDRFEGYAKNEILAYLKDRSESPDEILNNLFRPKKYGGFYDYYKNWHEKEGKEEKNKILARLQERGTIDKVKDILGQGPGKFIDKTMDKILVREYHQDLSRAMIAVTKLRDRGFSNEKIVKLLMIEPLGNWLKVARRLKEAKKEEK